MKRSDEKGLSESFKPVFNNPFSSLLLITPSYHSLIFHRGQKT